MLLKYLIFILGSFCLFFSNYSLIFFADGQTLCIVAQQVSKEFLACAQYHKESCSIDYYVISYVVPNVWKNILSHISQTRLLQGARKWSLLSNLEDLLESVVSLYSKGLNGILTGDKQRNLKRLSETYYMGVSCLSTQLILSLVFLNTLALCLTIEMSIFISRYFSWSAQGSMPP